MQNIPVGYCQCGCGKPTPLSIRTSKQKGTVAGQPTRFLTGHMNKLLKPDDVKFMRHVSRQENSCWFWTATKDKDGYGRFSMGGRFIMAHRASFKLFKGEVPDGLLVLHTCDVPSCVNPDHLFIGSSKDNTQDMMTKGRGHKARGEKAGPAKLTELQVIEIKQSNLKTSAIAVMYGVLPKTIKNIKNGVTWRHI